jgi:uncharacterized damage-inducible protein DinB
MKTIQDFITDFQDLWEGSFWASTNFVETLKGLSPTQATAKPLPHIHSIAQLVWHITAWRKVMIENLKGNTDYHLKIDSNEDWKWIDEGDTTAWEQAVYELESSQKEILKILSDSGDDLLARVYKQKHTLSFLINGVIQHDIYHLGQMRMVKGLLK